MAFANVENDTSRLEIHSMAKYTACEKPRSRKCAAAASDDFRMSTMHDGSESPTLEFSRFTTGMPRFVRDFTYREMTGQSKACTIAPSPRHPFGGAMRSSIVSRHPCSRAYWMSVG